MASPYTISSPCISGISLLARTPPESRTPLSPIKSRTHGRYARGACYLSRSGLLMIFLRISGTFSRAS